MKRTERRGGPRGPVQGGACRGDHCSTYEERVRKSRGSEGGLLGVCHSLGRNSRVKAQSSSILVAGR